MQTDMLWHAQHCEQIKYTTVCGVTGAVISTPRCMLQVDAVNSPPTVANVVAGVGPSAATATAHGSFNTTAEANSTATVLGLIPATNYTVSWHLYLPLA